MCVYAADPRRQRDFSSRILGAKKASNPLDPKGTRFYFNPTQFVEVLPLPSDASLSRMACVAWNPEDATSLSAMTA